MENQIIAKQKNDIEKHYPYDIGMALSGGGAKGFAHLGALQALEEKGIRLERKSKDQVSQQLMTSFNMLLEQHEHELSPEGLEDRRMRELTQISELVQELLVRGLQK